MQQDARAGIPGGKGSTLGEDGGHGGRPSTRWSIPAAPNPNSGTAVKMGRREAWARFLAYEVRGAACHKHLQSANHPPAAT